MMSASQPLFAGNACTATSGATVPAVVELYTSEGCDSCPPADRWVASMKDEAVRGKVIPLAFHVDYWDYLGWKDPFGDPVYSARHREAAARGGARVVYTPQVLLDGREFQQWRRTSPDKVSMISAQKPARAQLSIAATPGASRVELGIGGKLLPGLRNAEAWIAVFENGLSSDVKAGENRGVLLRHEFVVRRWLGPFEFEDGALKVARTVDLPPETNVSRSGIAVVAVDDRGAIVQAVSLRLKDCAG